MSTFQFIAFQPGELQETVANAVKGQLKLFFQDLKATQPDDLLTRTEAAALLKVNISTINNWRKSGKLTPVGMGNRVYFRRSDIERSLVEIR